MPNSRSIVVMAVLSSQPLPGSMGMGRGEVSQQRKMKMRCGYRQQKWERKCWIFLAATHKDVVMLAGTVAAGAGRGTLGRRTYFVGRGGEQGVDDLKWMGLCGNGYCVPWAPLVSNTPKQKGFFSKWFCPLNICALSANTAKTSQDMDVFHFSSLPEKGRDEKFQDEISISRQNFTYPSMTDFIFLFHWLWAYSWSHSQPIES